PVTELVTGIDLVREQIRVAWGENLSFTQEDVKMNGHAIECRIYAEDPDHNFMPSPGRIERLHVPQGPGVRDDGGVYEGGEVSIFYDPMISKFAVWGRDRQQAIEKMRRALKEYRVDGIKTTLPFFRAVMEDDVFVKGDLDTGFIPAFREREKLTQPSESDKDMAMIAAALSYEKGRSLMPAGQSPNGDEPSRWAMAGRMAQLISK
ncbi:MAG: hypothetical protein KIT61_12290, partial [Pyrinomonadaceae bacterium]|nr:hypothetical protein [Pyrinomonadaceae bacterium]